MGAPVDARVARLAPCAVDAAAATDDTLAPPPPAGFMRFESFPEIRGGSGFSRFALLSDIELRAKAEDQRPTPALALYTPRSPLLVLFVLSVGWGGWYVCVHLARAQCVCRTLTALIVCDTISAKMDFE